MARKKTAPAPAAAPAPAPKATRVRHPAKQRALDLLKSLRLAVRGYVAATDGCDALAPLVEALPADWEPKRATSGPLEVGERVQLRPAEVGPYRSLGDGPHEIVTIYHKGRRHLCSVKGSEGTSWDVPVAIFMRAAVEAEAEVVDDAGELLGNGPSVVLAPGEEVF